MANYNTPWNKGKGKTPTEKKAALSAYYQANRDLILKKASDRYKIPNIRAKKKEYNRWKLLEFKYGVTRSIWEAMCLRQDSQCAICKTKKAANPTELYIDHCHITGKVRGLLCASCNRDMAIVDRPEKLEAALRYKRESQ